MHIVYFSILVAVMTYGFTIVQRVQAFAEQMTVPMSQYGAPGMTFDVGDILFAGDIMLGRGVEEMIDIEGDTYPFKEISAFVASHDYAIANFEGTVPKVHRKTKPRELQFSVKQEAMSLVANSGFDAVSLSNNHALDYGESGFQNTRQVAIENGIDPVGHPSDSTMYGTAVVTIGDTEVGLLTLHTLFNRNATATLETLISNLKMSSDVQFVFVHWGDEYQEKHSTQEEKLAHYLIEQGIDAIIGHHPHVIQDVELYLGKPIFYSLGNLVFDQYFSDAVQTGYFVQVIFERTGMRFEVFPYDSKQNRSQPTLQNSEEGTATLMKILPESYFTPNQIKSGAFVIDYDTSS